MPVTVRPTIAADLGAVIGEPLPYRISALTVLDGDRVLGVGGIAFPPGATPIAFVQPAADINDGTKRGMNALLLLRQRYKVSFHRAGLAAMALIRGLGLREVMATADPSDAAACRWLIRLGFQQCSATDETAVFRWRRRVAARDDTT